MQPIEKINYIDNQMKYGKIIDWEKILKFYKKLKCPVDKYQPNLPFDKANLFVIFSERDSGKTTNLLLYSMCAYVLYGVKLEWIRQVAPMIKPTNVTSMFNTIVQYDYISKITKGKFKSIYYYRKEVFFANYEDGKTKPVEIDETPFMRFNSIDDMQNIKSNYNSPNGDLIVLDEFQSATNRENEFEDFFHIVSSIKRERISTKVLFLGNTLTPYNYYFRMMDLTKYIIKMQPNNKILVKTKRGMNVYLEWFNRLNAGTKVAEKDRENELQYYGFDGLNSITGGTWDIKNYPHITKQLDEDKEVLEEFYLKFQLYNLNLKLCYEEKIGTFVYVRPCSESAIRKAYNKNKIIFVDYAPVLFNEIYGIGKSFKNLSNLWTLYNQNKFLYSTNDIGELLNEYINTFS